MEFAKGHGTGNDFVVLPDIGAELDLTPAFVTALCDRRTGLGADGVLRVVPSAQVPEATEMAVAGAYWFMDYRNADGSVAEMCGNGVRVYVRWLQRAGLVAPGPLAIATRDGVKVVTVSADLDRDLTVDMGPPGLSGERRQVFVGDLSAEGIAVSMGNPHVIVEVADLAAAGRLREAPLLEPPGDANVEFVVVHDSSHLSMRVYERGVGETQSCGTGACAAAVAVAIRAGRRAGRYSVDVLGGRLDVDWTGSTVLLTGPAEIVADGHLAADWVANRRG